MSWRTIVVSSSAKLDYQLGYLVVRKDVTVKVHISEISILIIESTAVSLTAALLNELMKKKIKEIFSTFFIVKIRIQFSLIYRCRKKHGSYPNDKCKRYLPDFYFSYQHFSALHIHYYIYTRIL